MRRVNQRKITLVLSIIGIIFFTIGLSILVGLWWKQHDVEQTSLLIRNNTISSISHSGGERIMIEGRLSVQNPTHTIYYKNLEPFVVSKIEKGDVPLWTSFEQVTPRLLLDVADGQIRVVNDNYTYKDMVTPPVAHPDIGFAGLQPGDQVVVIGTVVQDTTGGRIHADYIGSGPGNVYIENLNLELLFLSLILYPVAWFCLGVGLFLTLLAVGFNL